MKVILIYILALIFVSGKEIVYNNENKRLTWDDFRVVNVLNDASAETSTEISYSFEETNGKIKVSVYCSFDKKRSFVVKGKQTFYLLNHEQRHFDLSHIYANLLYQRLLQNENLTEEKVKYIHGKAIAEWQDIQDRYDLETEHSIDATKQEMWDRTIDKMLKNNK